MTADGVGLQRPGKILNLVAAQVAEGLADGAERVSVRRRGNRIGAAGGQPAAPVITACVGLYGPGARAADSHTVRADATAASVRELAADAVAGNIGNLRDE